MKVQAPLLLLLLLSPAVLDGEPGTVNAALQALYNFDFPAAHQALNGYIAAHPSEPLPYAFRAAAYLFSELDRMGVLESEFLTDDQKIAEKKKEVRPDAAVRALFLQAVQDADARAEAELKTDPNDRSALFALCVAGGISTDYMALVEKRQIASLTPARRSSGYAQRLLRLDPTFYDAYLTAGFSEYMLGSLPFFIRWFVHFDGVEGNKQRAVEDLELVARRGRYFAPLAKIFLGIIDLREKKPAEARRLLGELAHDYPANLLYRKELAKLGGAGPPRP